MPPTRLLLAAIVILAACESDAHKIERLKLTQATSCLPVLEADSAAASLERAEARVKAGTGNLEELQADLAEMKRSLPELKRQSEMTPAQAAEKLKADLAARTRCDLARRDVNLFMGGH